MKRIMSFWVMAVVSLTLVGGLIGCPGGGGGNSGGPEGGSEEGGGGSTGTAPGEGECFDCDPTAAVFLHLDGESISALLSVDPDTIETAALSTLKAQTDGGETVASPLQGLDDVSGAIHDALRAFNEEVDDSFDRDSDDGLNADDWNQVPRIASIAQCNDYVYLVFEHPFLAREVAADGTLLEDYEDPWSWSSPFSCQLFRTTDPMSDYQAGDRVQRSNLTPILCGRQVNTWDRRRNAQFDGDCNLFVTVDVPSSGKQVLLRVPTDPGADEEYTDDDFTEIINANICFERYLVTTGGDVHYTGRTSIGSDCSGDSFYREVGGSGSCNGANAGVLTEITRDWWDYEFEPLDNGTVVFYGPDPTQDGVPSWDSSCLFSFDSCQTGDARYTKLVNCTSDWWRYVNEGATDAAFRTTANDTERERCAEQFYTYRGSNSPDKILSIDRNGDATEEICVVADVEYKKQGSWQCNICVNSGDNCENSSGMITEHTTQATCQAVTGNTWFANNNECYNDITTGACTLATVPTTWDMTNDWCRDPGSSWSQTYSGLSCILADKSVEFVSSTTETVTNAWVAGNRLIYSSVQDGTYYLKAVTFDRVTTDGDAADGSATVATLVSGIEMYEVAVNPTAGTDQLWINGLRFSDNSYVFGTYDFATGLLETESAFTGLVDTILILGGN